MQSKINLCILVPPKTNEVKFFIRFGSGKSIINPTKEVDSQQKDFNLPSICSSNKKHVETMKDTAGLDATSSASNVCLIMKFKDSSSSMLQTDKQNFVYYFLRVSL